MKVLVLSSLAFSLVNFRGDLLRAMVNAGHDVIACAPDRDPEVETQLESMGIVFRHTPMQRAGTNPLADLSLMLTYYRLMRSARPDLVMAYTQKPIIYGGLVARMVGSIPFYALMSGLGQMFSDGAGYSRLLRQAVVALYRQALRRAQTIFVFNADDRADMLELGIVSRDQKVIQVPGSGVSLERFEFVEPVTQPLRFLLVARLMRNKGIMEFLEAARHVRDMGVECEFQILGRYEEENPEGISPEESKGLAREYGVTFIPGTSDVRPYLARSSVFVLPSYYREGLPRTILEAMATGRAVITTDMPGCRDPITDGTNGFLVRPRDAAELAEAMAKFARRPELVEKMGMASRRIAERKYDVRLVNRVLMRETGLDRDLSRTSRPIAIESRARTTSGSVEPSH